MLTVIEKLKQMVGEDKKKNRSKFPVMKKKIMGMWYTE